MLLVNAKFLTKPNVMIVLLEYIDLFQSEWQHETNIWEGLPSSLLFYIVVFYFSIAIVTNYVYFAQICSYYANILFLAFAFLLF